jgi:hypothetical protein
MNDDYSIDWLKDLVDQIPVSPRTRRNLFDIAGFPHWETVVSNFLGFYFDPAEDHGLDNLFFESLLDLIELKTDRSTFTRKDFEAESFIVDREVTTDKRGRIDILIYDETEEGEYRDEESGQRHNWAVIIENKIGAWLYNDLDDYWKSVPADIKTGVVLSIGPVDKNLMPLKSSGIRFVNITHRELNERVLKNLPAYYLRSDDRHLLLLKEYFANLNSFYMDINRTEAMDKTLKLFQEHQQEIQSFKAKDMDLLRFVSDSVFAVMKEFGFTPDNSKNSSKTKHFYFDGALLNETNPLYQHREVLPKFRLWLNLSQLRYDSTIDAVVELWDKSNTIYGDRLKEKLEQLNIETPPQVTFGKGGASGSGYQHIYNIDIPLGDFQATGFQKKFCLVMKENFFEHPNRYLETAAEELQRII